VKLVDARGIGVAEQLTSYDGYYLFERVLPGDYQIRVEPERQGVEVSERGISVSPGELIVGVDFQLLLDSAG
jgi:protocatechuate 3,4-dioxygenase beta subunit